MLFILGLGSFLPNTLTAKLVYYCYSNHLNNVYFRLRFGLVDTINTFLRLEIFEVWGENLILICICMKEVFKTESILFYLSYLLKVRKIFADKKKYDFNIIQFRALQPAFRVSKDRTQVSIVIGKYFFLSNKFTMNNQIY